MTAKLGFIGIVVRDMAASLEFYRAVGVPIPEGQDGEPHVDARLEDGAVLAWDTVAMIRSFDPDYVPPTGGHRIALAFDQGSAQDVDATYAKLTGAGFIGKVEPWDAPWGQRYATVMDPDGNEPVCAPRPHDPPQGCITIAERGEHMPAQRAFRP
jgi:glyoxalase family protein